MAEEAKWRLLGREMGLQRPRCQQVIKRGIGIERATGKLDSLEAPGRPPLADQLPIGMGQLLAGPLDRGPGRALPAMDFEQAAGCRLKGVREFQEGILIRRIRPSVFS